jgi:hypothetical protein
VADVRHNDQTPVESPPIAARCGLSFPEDVLTAFQPGAGHDFEKLLFGEEGFEQAAGAARPRAPLCRASIAA